MSFRKGRQKTGGRSRGASNKATRNAREAIAAFVESNAHRLEAWLDKIAEDSPLAAFNAFMSVCEYVVPKMSRQEMTGRDGDRLQINVVTGIDRATIEAGFQKVKQIEHAPTG